jgi:hypothetical protein
VIINGTKGTIYFKLPVPPERKEKEEFSVLPIESLYGAGVTIGRTFSITFHLTLFKGELLANTS